MADVFKVLADPTRRAILDELQKRSDQTLFELCGRLTMNHGLASSRQAVSQHLDVLEEVGLVIARREGRYKLHCLDTAPLEVIAQRWPTSNSKRRIMRINVTSVFVDDQDKALRFYTDVLGFQKKTDVPIGEFKWLTVVSPEEPNGTELLLEPDVHPAVGPYKEALVADGIPATSFAVKDVATEFERLKGLGVTFTQEPVDMGTVTTAVLDDTCGNLIQIAAEH